MGLIILGIQIRCLVFSDLGPEGMQGLRLDYLQKGVLALGQQDGDVVPEPLQKRVQVGFIFQRKERNLACWHRGEFLVLGKKLKMASS